MQRASGEKREDQVVAVAIAKEAFLEPEEVMVGKGGW
jgi:hypothetical protein